MRFDRKQSGPNEIFEKNGEPYERYRPVLEEIRSMGTEEWDRRTERAHELLLEEQRSFGIPEGDKTHPIDYLPRVVSASDWKKLERGTAQRMRAINEFLRRLEAGKEELVPKEVIASSTLYDPDLPTRFGEVPPARPVSTSSPSKTTAAGDTFVSKTTSKCPSASYP